MLNGGDGVKDEGDEGEDGGEGQGDGEGFGKLAAYDLTLADR